MRRGVRVPCVRKKWRKAENKGWVGGFSSGNSESTHATPDCVTDLAAQHAMLQVCPPVAAVPSKDITSIAC